MSRSEREDQILYSRDTRRLLYLALLTCISTCTHAFSLSQFHTPSFISRHSIIQQQQQHNPKCSSSTALYMSPRRKEPDEAEWKALLAALQMYKAAYGDLKVPSRFIVPGMPPWPESAWEMKLGQKVGAIRSTGKYVQDNEQRRKILEDMGFLWRLRAAETSAVDVSFDQIYLALQTFLKETGKTNVPASFVVPDCDPWPESTRGLPLGKKLATVRTKSFQKNNPGAKEKLEALGFQLNSKVAANDTRFQKVYDALVTYKDLNGDLLVPQPFVVPDESPDWPESTWGLRLGARVNAIRSQGTFVNTNPDRRKQLDEIGFVWSPPPSATGRRRGRRTKQEMEAQRAAEDAMISRKVEEEKSQTASAMENLFGPSFAFEETPAFEATTNVGAEGAATPSWSFDGSGEIEASRAAEQAAKQPQDEYLEPVNLNDTLEVAKQKAIDAGVIVIGDDGVMRKGQQEKDIPWFNDDFGQDFVFEDVIDALTIYKSMYGDFTGLVENDEFVIPAPGADVDDSVFAEDDDEAVLDPSTRAAAAIASYEKEGKRQESNDLIAAEIQRLQQETESSTLATTAVQTKLSDESWPEHLAGMGLGNIVRRIRDGSLEVKHLPERKTQLDAIDFDWGDPKYFIDIPFEKAMCSMYAYYLVRGDMFVYEDFVMPDEDPWPRALAGYEVGKAVKRIRELQNSFEAYHTEKVALLRAIDFVWFPTVALPLDPNEPEMSSEMLMVSALGHPDYAKMIDIPMGLPDKIIADGPFFETDDPKLWWRKWHNWDYVKDYWYAQGRRDNAFVLRENGYPTLAQEHEDKYGPGMFQQLEELMEELHEGVQDKSKEEKDAYVERLNYFREEMTGCRDLHPKKRKALLEELDTAMLGLMTDGKLETVTEETLQKLKAIEEEQEEYDAVMEEEIEVDPADYGAAVGSIDDYEEEDYDDDDDEFDLVDELDLDDDDDDDDDIEDDDEEILAEADEDDLIDLEDEEEDAFA